MSSRILNTIFIVLYALLYLPLSGLAGENRWTSSGPYGGYYSSFVFHPQTSSLIFTTETDSFGDLYRSRNGGASWERLNLSGAGMLSVRIHPQNAGTILAAGNDVYASTDQGDTWRRIARAPFKENIHDMEFHASDPQTLYAVNPRGVFKSTDGGRKWTQKNAGLKLPGCCGTQQLEVDPTNGNVVYASLGRTVYKSTDGGGAWKSAGNGLTPSDVVGSLAIDPGNPQTLYFGASGGVFKTTNAGASWFSTNCDCGSNSVTVDPKNSQTVYTTSSGVLKSTNGGNTWKGLNLPAVAPVFNFLSVAAHPNTNQVFLGGQGIGVFRSNNSGGTWQTVNNGLDAAIVTDLGIPAQKAGQIFAVSWFGGQLYESRNNGNLWNVVKTLTRYLVADVKVHPSNSNLVAVALSYGPPSAAISTNGGKSWAFKGSLTNARSVAFDIQDQRTLYVISPSEGVAKSTDQGSTWNLVNSGLTDLSVTTAGTDPANRSNLFVGTDEGRIFKSTNGGMSWENRSSGLRNYPVRQIAVDPTNSNNVYAATEHALFKSMNGGQSWAAKSKGTPTGFDFRFVTVDASRPQTVFAGGYGLFVSTDAAENWSVLDSTGLERYLLTETFLISPSQSNTFFIGTARGVYSFTRAGTPGGPVIEQIVPPRGKPGDSVTINGRNFGATQGNSTIQFGSVHGGTAQSWSDTRITVRVPSGAQTGSVTVTVASRKSNPFDFVIVPTSGNIQPSSGPASGGTRVTLIAPPAISGNQLFNVIFGSTLASDLLFSPPNTITCTSPPGSGTVEVFVTTSVVSTKIGNFTYQ